MAGGTVGYTERREIAELVGRRNGGLAVRRLHDHVHRARSRGARHDDLANGIADEAGDYHGAEIDGRGVGQINARDRHQRAARGGSRRWTHPSHGRRRGRRCADGGQDHVLASVGLVRDGEVAAVRRDDQAALGQAVEGAAHATAALHNREGCARGERPCSWPPATSRR